MKITTKRILLFLLVVLLFIVLLRIATKPKESRDPLPEISIEDISYDSTQEYVPPEEDVLALSRMVYGLAGQVPDIERAALVWCVLNRVDSSRFPNTVKEVCEQKDQFNGYNAENPVTVHNRIIVSDVLLRYHNEQEGMKDAGRVLPSTYYYCRGNGEHLYFTEDFNGLYPWMYDCENPYE